MVQKVPVVKLGQKNQAFHEDLLGIHVFYFQCITKINASSENKFSDIGPIFAKIAGANLPPGDRV
jgi:hypothetical protein